MGAQRVQATPRAEQARARMWAEMATEVRARLGRIDRGETTAPSDRHVRCWRVLVGQEVQR